jgi:hypothetical protein
MFPEDLHEFGVTNSFFVFFSLYCVSLHDDSPLFKIFSRNFFDFLVFSFFTCHSIFAYAFPYSKLPVKKMSRALRHVRPRGATEYPRRALEGRSGTKLGPLFGGHRGAIPQLYNIVTFFRMTKHSYTQC